MNWKFFASAVIASAFASVAAAQDVVQLGAPTSGYTYFNRSGASTDEHDLDVRACAVSALSVVSVDAAIGNNQGLIPALMSIGPGRATFVSAVENCMVVRGWRVVRLEEREGRALSEQEAPQIAAQLAPWVGATEPHGEIVRSWRNDAADARTDRYEIRARRTANGALSIMSLGNVTVEAVELGQTQRAELDRRWPRRPLRPEDFGEAPADAAIVVFQTRGLSMRNGIGFSLMRMGPDENVFPSSIDGGPDLVSVFVPLISNRREGNWRAFALPAGRWRIASMGILPVLNFCLGGPSFEVSAGEVVYAGGFDLGSEALRPDMTLEPARAWVADPAYAERMRAAEYTNGWTGMCGDNAIYALEFEGYPFRDGYAWGSAYGAQPVQTSSPNEVVVAPPPFEAPPTPPEN